MVRRHQTALHELCNPHNSLFLRRVSGCAWLVAACSILLCGALHSAGAKKEELDVLLPGIIAAIILFAIGVCFAFFFMLPMGIAFMSWMSQGMQLEMFPDAQSYYSMVIFLTIAVGITFELPLVEFILIYVGILDVKWLENNRRMVFLIILIFATVITPPDAITQVSLTIPLYLMYEVALRLGKKMRRAKLRREAEREKLEAIEEEKERKEYAKQSRKKGSPRRKRKSSKNRSLK